MSRIRVIFDRIAGKIKENRRYAGHEVFAELLLTPIPFGRRDGRSFDDRRSP